ncbi:hypothetical protein [Pseudoalteromonas luteoviolacea]|uniref:Uncharacterized protein n=1 Tax=Pseudoalteromonas luteoviolacea DSM 6061 TaxID=1365250 RepID=A0A166V2S2_9GAMM|nr:hypothetical protein [Pseudoalteromonas luteoviolacea]KZN31653.1 hypothetical protein N475_04160 [Pseudoalteromonas luteoviolacea DSM 6061]KZN54512.1 hypothetical protein N474_01975 [Pseudoalteromonas luteoviolacea CPMOR-2]MBE0388987.1 hypothetical protein [Pseudoalteromonas luteoviolacea DSM 6061]TQF70350.1 hypothetical protein FLM44_04440 [Pseudoalteromonas luteoviolacea]
MKTTVKALTLIAGTLFVGQAFSAELVCAVYAKSGGNSWGNGTKNCMAFDYSFGNSTNGRFYLKNVTKDIKEVRWNGDARCASSTSTSCNATIRAYSSNTATATILYKDGTWETTNTARANYETGY